MAETQPEEQPLLPSPSAHFRVLDLPSEIRDLIWAACLTAQRHCVPATHHPTGLSYTKLDHRMQVRLLRVSKQVYEEARPIMLRSNRIVKITVDQMNDLSLIVFALEIPVFFYRHNIKRVDRPLWADLPDDLLLHTIMTSDPWLQGHHGYRTMLLLEEDHDAVVRILAEEYDRLYGGFKAAMHIEIRHNSAAFRQQAQDTARADRLTAKLLAPYGKYFRDFKGYDHAVIAHSSTPSVRQGIIDQMRLPRSFMQQRLLLVRQERNSCVALNISGHAKENFLRQSFTKLFMLAKGILPIHPGSVISNPGSLPDYVVTAPSTPEAETQELLQDIADEYVFLLMFSALLAMPASAGYSSDTGPEVFACYARVIELMSQLPLVSTRIFGTEVSTGDNPSWTPNAKHTEILRERARHARLALDEAVLNKASGL